MAISRMQMNRQLRAGGGIMDVTLREKFGLGSKLKKFVRKVIPNEIAEVATKAAPFVAPFNPLLAAGMAGIGGFDQTGSIGKSLKSGLLTYGGGQAARYLGGAGFQQGVNPFAGADFSGGIMSGIQSLGSSPIGTTTGLKLGQYPMFGGPQAVPEGTYLPTDFATEALPLEQATAGLTNAGGEIAKQTTGDLLKSIVSPQSTLGERATALKDLGGKALKAIYTDKEGNLDKMAVAGTIAGVTSYVEAKKLAEEAGLVEDEDEYTEEMYNADKAMYAEKYGEYLTPSAFGLKDGGRIGYAFGSPEMPSREGITSITLSETNDDTDDKKLTGIETLQDEDRLAIFPKDIFSANEISRLFSDKSLSTNMERKQLYKILMNPGQFPDAEMGLKKLLGRPIEEFKKGGRVKYAMGSPEQNAMAASQASGIPLNVNPAGATELDMRNTGGFIPPVGVKEKADDIPAMLSNNEFVFTADAVRAAGGGSVNKGAKKMYDLMKSLEGKVV